MRVFKRKRSSIWGKKVALIKFILFQFLSEYMQFGFDKNHFYSQVTAGVHVPTTWIGGETKTAVWLFKFTSGNIEKEEEKKKKDKPITHTKKMQGIRLHLTLDPSVYNPKYEYIL